MSSELLATYAGLGTYNRDLGEYHRGVECLACVKDLIRALREDDSQCEIRRHLGQAGILKKDLLYILVDSSDDPALRNDVIRLLVNLTQPAYLCFGNTYPQGKETDLMKCYMEVNYYLRAYKEAFTTEVAMNVLGTMLADLCQKEWEEREDDDVIVIERILLLIRNLLHVSADPQEEKRTEDDVSIHDQIIWNLHINGIDDLLVFLGSDPSESQWCLHMLEIFFLLFKEQSPAGLASTGSERSQQEKQKDEDLVDAALAKEKARKKRAQQMRGMRHSSFGGTFVIKNQKSISGKDRIYHRPIGGLKDYSFDTEKRPRRVNKRRRPAKDPPSDRISTYSIRLVLKNLCVLILECCYNPLMKVVKENIMRRRAMENDETYYLWSLRFFMQFNRIHDFRVDIVGETLHLPALHYIITLTANYYESMLVEKRSVMNARQWGQRLHYVIQCYHEILLYIQRMSQSHDEALRDSTGVIISNLLYHSEYRDIFLTLLRNYYEVFQSKAYLRDLVDATHVYVKMMEQYCGKNKHMVVQQKRKGGKGGAKKKKKEGGSGRVLNQDQLIDLWETIDARVEELLEGVEPLPVSHAPFNAASQFSIEEQKIGAMGSIKMLLIDARHPEAVSLLRATREVWPGEEFGNPDISVDDELDIMRDILYNPVAALPAPHLLGGEESGEEEEEGGGGATDGVSSGTVELEFNLKSYLERFTNNKIVKAYSLVLADYGSNGDTINHAVVKMLYRLAVQLDMRPLLYQMSIFKTLQQILEEPLTPRMKELQKFSRYIVQGFFHMAEKNPLMFVELLFWKTSRDCYELEMGYGTVERQRERVKKSTVWTRDQEEELATLYQTYKDEEDVVGCLEAALEGSEVTRTRRQIAKQLVQQCLVLDKKELNRNQYKKKGVWSEEELDRLKDVFREVDGSVDPKQLIKAVAEQFPHRGVRDVIHQLREVGLLAQRKGGAREDAEPAKYKSAEFVNSSEDESSDNEPANTSASGRDLGHSPSGRGLVRSPSGHDLDHSPNGRGLDCSSIGQNLDHSPSGRGINQSLNERDLNHSSSGCGLDPHVLACVRELYRQGHSEDLQWLEAYLHDEARDRTLDDEWEEMCVVAVSNRVAKAMEKQVFQQLLAGLGLHPPTQQECYWCIPSTMSPHQLTTAANALRENASQRDLSNQSVRHSRDEGVCVPNGGVGGAGDVWDEEPHYGSGSNDGLTRNEALQLLAQKRNQEPDISTSGSNRRANRRGMSPNRRGVPPKVPPSSKRPRLALQSEFLEGDEEEESVLIGVPLTQGQGEGEGAGRSGPSRRGRNQRLLELDSDDEEEEEGEVIKSSGQNGGLVGISSGSGQYNSSSEDEHDLVICHDSN